MIQGIENVDIKREIDVRRKNTDQVINIQREYGLTKQRKRYVCWGTLMIALHLLAILCERINQEPMFETSLSIFLSLVRASIYIALFTAWGFSVRYRIIAVYTRFYLSIEAALMVLWMLIRTVKYTFIADPNANRMLWYLYYLPMLLIPLIAIFASLSLGKYSKFKLPKWTIPFSIVTALLIGLVMTNDVHQLVFSFPKDAVVFSDRDYRYGPGYYTVLGVEGVSILLAFGIMLHRCHRPKNRKIMLLPAIPVSGMILYTILYITNYAFLKRFAPDLTISFCCLTIFAFESCIGNGLIPVNAHYRELFEHAGFPVCITNQKDEVYMESEHGKALAKKVEQYREQTEIMPDRKTRISVFPITGGRVFWEEDIAEIQEEIERLQDLQESLKESHTISLEEYRTNKEKARLEEVNRIYDKMQMETSGCLNKIQQLLKELSEEAAEEKERQLLGKIAVYGAYFKRRNNLLFVAETQKRIRGAELTFCLRESFAALAYLEIKTSYEVEEQGDFSLYDIIRIYDLFQEVIEETLDDLTAVMAMVRKGEDQYILYLSLSVKNGAPTFPTCFEVEQEEEGEYLLTCFFAQKNEGRVMDGSFL